MDKLQHIDELIDSALRSEPLRDVPVGFSGRVMQRISAEAENTERAAAGSQRLVRPLIFMAVLAGAVVVIPMGAFYGQWEHQALPGGMGLLDYALAWIGLSRMASLTDFAFVGGTALLGITALLGAVWAVSRRRVAGHRAEH